MVRAPCDLQQCLGDDEFQWRLPPYTAWNSPWPCWVFGAQEQFCLWFWNFSDVCFLIAWLRPWFIAFVQGILFACLLFWYHSPALETTLPLYLYCSYITGPVEAWMLQSSLYSFRALHCLKRQFWGTRRRDTWAYSKANTWFVCLEEANGVLCCLALQMLA